MSDPAPGRLPDSIGSFRILSRLGQGGFGVVYEAEQQSPRRRIALKVVRGSSSDPWVQRMFERETTTLARLQHPNIGPIYESGSTETGELYFAMELVRGAPLDEYLRDRPEALTSDEVALRLILFRQIADAVHYAHQRGVIHRDLKPLNIFVTEEAKAGGSDTARSTEPLIKVLDFGLARITAEELSLSTEVTALGVIQGTPQYMSPEQARGASDEIDTRTDVYSLGVVLYEMLTGQRPYDLQGASAPVMLRRICDDPPRPLRQASPSARRLDRDLETIVGKALEKEPNRRYASAAAMADDVERFLTSQPILARPPSVAYQLRKLVRRNKLASGIAAILMLSVFAFGIAMTVLYRRADDNRIRALGAEARARDAARTAKEEAVAANAVAEFLESLFSISDPSEARGRSITAREILGRGADRLRTELIDLPRVRARLLLVVGTVYRKLGLPGDAQPLLEEARALLEDAPMDDPMRRTAIVKLATLYNDRARFDDTVTLLRGPTEEWPEDRLRVEAANVLAVAWMRLGRSTDAEPLLRHALMAAERDEPRDLELELTLAGNLAMICRTQERFDEARELQERVTSGLRKLLGEDAPKTLGSLDSLAQDCAYSGEMEKAERYFRQALETRERVLGPEHPETLISVNNLGYLMKMMQRFDEALPFARRVLDVRAASLEADHPSLASARSNLAEIYRGLNRLEEALAELRLAESAFVSRLGPGHPASLRSGEDLVRLLIASERRQEAEQVGRKLIERLPEGADRDRVEALLR